MKADLLPLDILYEDARTVVVQTHAGAFEKFGEGELYGEANVGLHVEDDAKLVLARRATLLDQLARQSGIDRIHWLNQVHGDHVLDVGSAHTQKLYNADAMICREAGTGLAIMTADCVPVAVFDGTGAIACIHAGWQGLVNGIIAKTVKMAAFKSPPKAIIGACISQDAYQIGADLGARIIDAVVSDKLVPMDAQVLYDAIILDDGADKVRIDIAKLARIQLECLGVTVINESVPCSYHEPKYYSYRAQTHAKKPATGRMATIIATKPDHHTSS